MRQCNISSQYGIHLCCACNVRCVTIRIEVNSNIVIVAFESWRKCEMKLGITHLFFLSKNLHSMIQCFSKQKNHRHWNEPVLCKG
jgi:hypothetical protein